MSKKSPRTRAGGRKPIACYDGAWHFLKTPPVEPMKLRFPSALLRTPKGYVLRKRGAA